jgi:hypothetical protein
MTAGRRPVAAALLVTVLAGCSGLPFIGSAPIADGVTVLAKADGWSPSVQGEQFSRFGGVLEIAYDEKTARAAWAAVVPADLPELSGSPEEPGRYGAFEAVDLDEQVLAVFSGGQSGTCPSWLRDVSVEDGRIVLEQHVPDGSCTSDYRPYRVVLALDRDKVPATDDLPTEDVVVSGLDDGLVVTYPAR